MPRTTHLIVAASLGACSTLAELPDPQECVSDDDCPVADDVCAPDTRVCVPGGDIPPRADLGFDIQELVGGNVVFRAEVGGCDEDIEYTQSRLVLHARELEQTFELEVIADAESPEPPLIPGLLTGAIELSQASRFARAPLLPPRVDYPTVDATSEMVTPLPTLVRWPRYHPFDAQPPVLDDGGFIVWRTIPDVGAPVLQMLVPPQLVPPVDDDGMATACIADTDCCELDNSGAACEATDPNFCVEDEGLCTAIGNPQFAFTFAYRERCALELSGRLAMIDGESLARLGWLGDVPLNIRHADTPEARLGVHAIDGVAIEDRPQQCTRDSDCIEGEQFCDTETSPGAGQCVLVLAGRAADSGSILTLPDLPEDPSDDENVGKFAANLYTYCSEDNIGYVRSFTISASPPGPVASLSYTFDVDVPPLMLGVTHPSATMTKDLCVPDWGASKTLLVQLVGKPVSLIGSGANEFECCDVGCLPASADVASTEPTQADTCDGRTSGTDPTVTVSASLVLDAADLAAWDDADCQPPDADANGVVGGIRREMDCSGVLSDATCVAPDLAAGKDGSPREYELRIESPTGSLFKSQTVTIAVDGSEEPQEIVLEERVLVRGRIVLDGATCGEEAVDGDCGSEGAVVRAERLRMPDETDADVVGPHLHDVTTYFDPIDGRQGGYVLPLDRGVYLITALPLSGSRGGPSEITVIDLREVDSLEKDLVLSSGQLVTLVLEDFDPRAQILPLDRGSWRGVAHLGRLDDPDLDRRFVDLNAIGECWQPADEPPQACRIRRLISGTSALSASQVGQLRFTARLDSDAASCSN